MARRSPSRWAAALVGPSLVGPSLVLIAAGAMLAVDQERGILPMLDVTEQVRSAEALVEALALEREQLIRHVRGLRSDPYEIEAVARAELGMVRPGEVVIRFEGDGTNAD